MISTDKAFGLLASSRRRIMLQRLAEGSATVRELSETVAATEMEIDRSQVDYENRQRVHVALTNSHIPKLAECGVIEVDDDQIHPTEAVEALVEQIEYADHDSRIRNTLSKIGLV